MMDMVGFGVGTTIPIIILMPSSSPPHIQVCTVLPGDMALQCQTLATLLVPKIIEYLITNFDASITCMDVGICPTTTRNDFACPVCQLLVNTTLQQALDPDLQVCVVFLLMEFV